VLRAESFCLSLMNPSLPWNKRLPQRYDFESRDRLAQNPFLSKNLSALDCRVVFLHSLFKRDLRTVLPDNERLPGDVVFARIVSSSFACRMGRGNPSSKSRTLSL
jgi:hypothetical protein